MILTFLSLFIFIVFAPSNESPYIPIEESKPSVEHIELEVEQEEQLEDDCRYEAKTIPHRDLSDYEVLAANLTEANEESEFTALETEQQINSEQSEEVQEKLELVRPEDEERE